MGVCALSLGLAYSKGRESRHLRKARGWHGPCKNHTSATAQTDCAGEAPIRHFFAAGVLLLALGVAPAASGVEPQVRNGLSMGAIRGDPSGVTLRGGHDERNATTDPLGAGPFPDYGADGRPAWFTGDYQMTEAVHPPDLYNQSHFGSRARGGLTGFRASFIKMPFDLFLELVPVRVLFVVPNPVTYYDIDLALGVRYRF